MPDDTPTQKAPGRKPKYDAETTKIGGMKPVRDETETTSEESTVLAPKVRVIFHDSDDTPEDFVLFALETYLGHDEPAARKLVEEICRNGSAVAATLQVGAAEEAQKRIRASAEESGYKYKVTLEPDSA